MTAIEFNHAVVSLKDHLRYFALSLTSDNDDANDLVQDTFVKVFSNRDKFRNTSNLKAWMFTIMKNTFINKYNRKNRVKILNDSSVDTYLLDQSQSGQLEESTPDAQHNYKELMKELKKMKDAYRIPFEMYFQGYKYKEIAEKMDLSIGTVKSRIFFSRKHLMEKLGDYAN